MTRPTGCIWACGLAAMIFQVGCLDGGLRQIHTSAQPGVGVRLEILPFTAPASFDDDPIPDGLEVVLRPVDRRGEPVHVLGTYRFELYEFRPGSAGHKGERVQFWSVAIDTPEAHRRWWDSLTQTYQLHLAWDRRLDPERKYVLEATRLGPPGEEGRLYGETVLEFEFSKELTEMLQQR